MTDFGRGLVEVSDGSLSSVRRTAQKPDSPGFYEMPAIVG